MFQTVRPSEFPSQQRLRRLIAAKCGKPATLHLRSTDAGHNELATDLAALPAVVQASAVGHAMLDRAMSLPPLVALGPDSTDRTAEFRRAQGGAA